MFVIEIISILSHSISIISVESFHGLSQLFLSFFVRPCCFNRFAPSSFGVSSRLSSLPASPTTHPTIHSLGRYRSELLTVLYSPFGSVRTKSWVIHSLESGTVHPRRAESSSSSSSSVIHGGEERTPVLLFSDHLFIVRVSPETFLLWALSFASNICLYSRGFVPPPFSTDVHEYPGSHTHHWHL